MTTHIIAFVFYTLAMLGVMFIAFSVYKNVVLGQNSHSTKLKIEDMLRLNQRKSLYVINYQGERFLIAGDSDSTTLISKLNTQEKQNNSQQNVVQIQKEQQSPAQESFETLEDKLIELKKLHGSKNVMRTILKEINSNKERY